MTNSNHIKQAATHTPGPWHRSIDKAVHMNITTTTGEMVAVVVKEHVSHDQRNANARLIAAAPEMLAALEAQEMAEWDAEAARRKGYFDRARKLRRAALARAKGGAA